MSGNGAGEVNTPTPENSGTERPCVVAALRVPEETDGNGIITPCINEDSQKPVTNKAEAMGARPEIDDCGSVEPCRTEKPVVMSAWTVPEMTGEDVDLPPLLTQVRRLPFLNIETESDTLKEIRQHSKKKQQEIDESAVGTLEYSRPPTIHEEMEISHREELEILQTNQPLIQRDQRKPEENDINAL